MLVNLLGDTLSGRGFFYALLLIILGYVTSVSTVLVFLLTLLIFALPGIPLAKKFCGELRTTLRSVFTVLIGLPISSGLCALVVYFVGFNAFLFFTVILLVSILFLVPALRSSEYRYSCDKVGPIFYVILSVVLLMLIYSYSNFGRPTASGLMFKDLYSTDLLHHMSVFRSLPYGLPSINPYFNGLIWHYYWLSHLFPATVYAVSGLSLDPMDIMLLALCLNTVLFFNLLYTFIASSRSSRLTVSLLLIISVFAYGYNDLYIAFTHLVTLLPQDLMQSLGLKYFIDDAYGGRFSGYSHGWFRNFLVEPHSTFALSLSLLLVTLKLKEQRDEIGSHLFMGCLLGAIFAFDAFLGAIMVSWTLIDETIALIKRRADLRDCMRAMTTLVPVMAVLLLLNLLGIITQDGSGLMVKPYVKMLLVSPIYFFIDYGPQILFAAFGAYFLKKDGKLLASRSLLTLFGVAAVFMFFVNVKDIGTTQMFRKAGMIIRIPLLFYAQVFLDNIAKVQFRYAHLMVGACVIIAFPTPFLDIYKLGDDGANSHIAFVRNQDVEACRWIKDNLPVDAIVQDFPSDITPIFAFGERKVSLGDWEHAKSGGASPAELKERIDKIKVIFSDPDPLVAYKILKQLNIDYLYVNRRCVELFGTTTDKFRQSGFFNRVFHNDEVAIYEIL